MKKFILAIAFVCAASLVSAQESVSVLVQDDCCTEAVVVQEVVYTPVIYYSVRKTPIVTVGRNIKCRAAVAGQNVRQFTKNTINRVTNPVKVAVNKTRCKVCEIKQRNQCN